MKRRHVGRSSGSAPTIPLLDVGSAAGGCAEKRGRGVGARSKPAVAYGSEEDVKHGRPMGRPYTNLFLRLTEDHYVIVHTYQHAAPLQPNFEMGVLQELNSIPVTLCYLTLHPAPLP
jgi:hypothetical protein